jgi:hypothetical protein
MSTQDVELFGVITGVLLYNADVEIEAARAVIQTARALTKKPPEPFREEPTDSAF